MPKHLYIVILITFCVGFFTGVFTYVETRDTKSSTVTPETGQIEEGFEVLAYTYGGCERFGCSSYRITDTGTYSYIKRSTMGVDSRYDDSISSKRLDELSQAINDTNFDAIIASQYSGACPTEYDAVAYRYEIRVRDKRYSIDSCTEDIAEDALFKVLADYFEIFSVTHRDAP